MRLYRKDTGLVAPSLPQCGLPERTISDFFQSQSQEGLQQPMLSHHLLGDIGGAMSTTQRGDGTCHQRSLGSDCRFVLMPIENLGSRPWLVEALLP